MTRLLLSAAAVAMIASPMIAEAKKTHPAPAKHKVVKKVKAEKKTS